MATLNAGSITALEVAIDRHEAFSRRCANSFCPAARGGRRFCIWPALYVVVPSGAWSH